MRMSAEVRPAGILALSNGSVMVTGCVKVVPSGPKSYAGPTSTVPDGAAASTGLMVMLDDIDSAPMGMTTDVPSLPLTVPPSAPTLLVMLICALDEQPRTNRQSTLRMGPPQPAKQALNADMMLAQSLTGGALIV